MCSRVIATARFLGKARWPGHHFIASCRLLETSTRWSTQLGWKWGLDVF